MLGTIAVKSLKVDCIIGCLESERDKTQCIEIDVAVEGSFSSVVLSDEPQDTVSYLDIAQVAKTVAIEGKFKMLETLSYHVLSSLFDCFPITKARIEVRKPHVLPEAETVYVVLEMTSEDYRK